MSVQSRRFSIGIGLTFAVYAFFVSSDIQDLGAQVIVEGGVSAVLGWVLLGALLLESIGGFVLVAGLRKQAAQHTKVTKESVAPFRLVYFFFLHAAISIVMLFFALQALGHVTPDDNTSPRMLLMFPLILRDMWLFIRLPRGIVGAERSALVIIGRLLALPYAVLVYSVLYGVFASGVSFGIGALVVLPIFYLLYIPSQLSLVLEWVYQLDVGARRHALFALLIAGIFAIWPLI